MKPIRLSQHASSVAAERGLRAEWIQSTVEQPDWREPDPSGARFERRFRQIGERDGRILRVVCQGDDDRIPVVTAFFDRGARKPK